MTADIATGHELGLPSESEWGELTVNAERRAMFSADLYFRECWADFHAIHAARATDVLRQVAMVSIKPDAVVGRRSRAIVEFAERHGLEPVLARPFAFNRHSMRELWRYDWHVYPVDRLAFSTLWYTATDVLMFLFRETQSSARVPASVRFSALKGHALPERRRPEQLRSVLRAPNRILNFVHIADEPADLVRELGIFFDRDERRAILKALDRPTPSEAAPMMQATIQQLEARYPEHDLAIERTLERLERAPGVDASAVGELRRLVAEQVKIDWDTLVRLIDPAAAGVERWDFITVASSVLQYERDVPSLLPGVSAADWERQSERAR